MIRKEFDYAEAYKGRLETYLNFDISSYVENMSVMLLNESYILAYLLFCNILQGLLTHTEYITQKTKKCHSYFASHLYFNMILS